MDAGAPDEQPQGTAAAPSPGRPRWLTWVAAAAVTAVVVVAAVLVLGGGGDDGGGEAVVATSEAQAEAGAAGGEGRPGGPGGMGTFGTVTAVDGTRLTVEATTPPTDGSDDGGTEVVTVETTDGTTVTETVEGTLGDLAVGDDVLVTGEEGADGIEATAVVDTGDQAAGFPGAGGGGDFAPPEGGDFEPPEGGFPGAGGGTAGEVTAIDGTTLTVRTGDGEDVVVVTSDETTITVTRTIAVADLAAGDTVTVMGETEGDTVTATSIRRGDLAGGFGGGRPGMAPPDEASTPTTTA